MKHIELEQAGAVGRSPPRRDGADKVTGRARYLDDLSFPGQLWGRTVRSRVPHGRIKKIWFDPEFDWADVVRVTADDIPGENVVHLMEDDQPILARDLIRHREEPIALLACADREKLEEALEHVRVEVEELEPVLDPLQSTTVFKSYRIVWSGEAAVTHVRFTYPGEAHELVARFSPSHPLPPSRGKVDARSAAG